ncbi:aspartate-semialdehyde dehydrogenase, partial [bacterium]|nr:aspartate-semialdehyde dehydrogenase [bacterium]
IVFFSAGANISKKYAPIAAANNCVVIDNSSAFRMEKKVALVIPEINSTHISKYKSKIIANPNCTTIISLMAIKPLYDIGSIRRIVATSFQSVSGAGNAGMTELISETKRFLSGTKKSKNKVFDRNIAFNVIPKIGLITKNGYSEEEMKLHNESRKILSDNRILISATTVRVPVLRSHSISINIEFEKKISLAKAQRALSKFPGIQNIKIDNPMSYPTPIDSSNKDDCLVGRLRTDYSTKNGLSLWVVGDQIRKGAALNAVQIAECLQEK